MATPRRKPRLGVESTRTGLSDRMKRSADEEELVADRGTNALLAKAREAGEGAERPDESTLSAVESLLRDV